MEETVLGQAIEAEGYLAGASLNTFETQFPFSESMAQLLLRWSIVDHSRLACFVKDFPRVSLATVICTNIEGIRAPLITQLVGNAAIKVLTPLLDEIVESITTHSERAAGIRSLLSASTRNVQADAAIADTGNDSALLTSASAMSAQTPCFNGGLVPLVAMLSRRLGRPSPPPALVFGIMHGALRDVQGLVPGTASPAPAPAPSPFFLEPAHRLVILDALRARLSFQGESAAAGSSGRGGWDGATLAAFLRAAGRAPLGPWGGALAQADLDRLIAATATIDRAFRHFPAAAAVVNGSHAGPKVEAVSAGPATLLRPWVAAAETSGSSALRYDWAPPEDYLCPPLLLADHPLRLHQTDSNGQSAAGRSFKSSGFGVTDQTRVRAEKSATMRYEPMEALLAVAGLSAVLLSPPTAGRGSGFDGPRRCWAVRALVRIAEAAVTAGAPSSGRSGHLPLVGAEYDWEKEAGGLGGAVWWFTVWTLLATAAGAVGAPSISSDGEMNTTDEKQQHEGGGEECGACMAAVQLLRAAFRMATNRAHRGGDAAHGDDRGGWNKDLGDADNDSEQFESSDGAESDILDGEMCTEKATALIGASARQALFCLRSAAIELAGGDQQVCNSEAHAGGYCYALHEVFRLCSDLQVCDVNSRTCNDEGDDWKWTERQGRQMVVMASRSPLYMPSLLAAVSSTRRCRLVADLLRYSGEIAVGSSSSSAHPSLSWYADSCGQIGGGDGPSGLVANSACSAALWWLRLLAEGLEDSQTGVENHAAEAGAVAHGSGGTLRCSDASWALRLLEAADASALRAIFFGSGGLDAGLYLLDRAREWRSTILGDGGPVSRSCGSGSRYAREVTPQSVLRACEAATHAGLAAHRKAPGELRTALAHAATAAALLQGRAASGLGLTCFSACGDRDSDFQARSNKRIASGGRTLGRKRVAEAGLYNTASHTSVDARKRARWASAGPVARTPQPFEPVRVAARAAAARGGKEKSNFGNGGSGSGSLHMEAALLAAIAWPDPNSAQSASKKSNLRKELDVIGAATAAVAAAEAAGWLPSATAFATSYPREAAAMWRAIILQPTAAAMAPASASASMLSIEDLPPPPVEEAWTATARAVGLLLAITDRVPNSAAFVAALSGVLAATASAAVTACHLPALDASGRRSCNGMVSLLDYAMPSQLLAALLSPICATGACRGRGRQRPADPVQLLDSAYMRARTARQTIAAFFLVHFPHGAGAGLSAHGAAVDVRRARRCDGGAASSGFDAAQAALAMLGGGNAALAVAALSPFAAIAVQAGSFTVQMDSLAAIAAADTSSSFLGLLDSPVPVASGHKSASLTVCDWVCGSVRAGGDAAADDAAPQCERWMSPLSELVSAVRQRAWVSSLLYGDAVRRGEHSAAAGGACAAESVAREPSRLVELLAHPRREVRSRAADAAAAALSGPAAASPFGAGATVGLARAAASALVAAGGVVHTTALADVLLSLTGSARRAAGPAATAWADWLAEVAVAAAKGLGQLALLLSSRSDGAAFCDAGYRFVASDISGTDDEDGMECAIEPRRPWLRAASSARLTMRVAASAAALCPAALTAASRTGLLQAAAALATVTVQGEALTTCGSSQWAVSSLQAEAIELLRQIASVPDNSQTADDISSSGDCVARTVDIPGQGAEVALVALCGGALLRSAAGSADGVWGTCAAAVRELHSASHRVDQSRIHRHVRTAAAATAAVAAAAGGAPLASNRCGPGGGGCVGSGCRWCSLSSAGTWPGRTDGGEYCRLGRLLVDLDQAGLG